MRVCTPPSNYTRGVCVVSVWCRVCWGVVSCVFLLCFCYDSCLSVYESIALCAMWRAVACAMWRAAACGMWRAVFCCVLCFVVCCVVCCCGMRCDDP